MGLDADPALTHAVDQGHAMYDKQIGDWITAWNKQRAELAGNDIKATADQVSALAFQLYILNIPPITYAVLLACAIDRLAKAETHDGGDGQEGPGSGQAGEDGTPEVS